MSKPNLYMDDQGVVGKTGYPLPRALEEKLNNRFNVIHLEGVSVKIELTTWWVSFVPTMWPATEPHTFYLTHDGDQPKSNDSRWPLRAVEVSGNAADALEHYCEIFNVNPQGSTAIVCGVTHDVLWTDAVELQKSPT